MSGKSDTSCQTYFRCRIRFPEHVEAGHKGRPVVVPEAVGFITAHLTEREFRWLKAVGVVVEIEAIVVVTTIRLRPEESNGRLKK